MNLKVLIADDEKQARALIAYFLKELQPTCEVTEMADGSGTLACLEKGEFDIVFLDIQMPFISGVEILKKMPAENLPAVIFTTAFDDYTLAAFDYNAIDYLLKPFNKTRFSKALLRAINYTELRKIKNEKNYLSSISIKRGTKTIILPVQDIEFFQTEDDYISVVTPDGKYLLTSTLAELENRLNPDVFIRVHKSTIINADFVKNIESHVSGDLTITTKTNKQVRASRNYRQKLRVLLGKRKLP